LEPGRDGNTLGTKKGSTIWDVDVEGTILGSVVDGKALGSSEGESLGRTDGNSLGINDGVLLAFKDGNTLGDVDGIRLGKSDGISFGNTVPHMLGMMKGGNDGIII